ncbi:hypothetical protein [Streptococcus sp.]|uniref:hypothetical protein n=1 Tax=Streptococcus sp. TaxID=1306 RepID=UPI00359F723C
MQIGFQKKQVFLVLEQKKAVISDVLKYDTIVLGGGLYASGIAGLSFLKKNIKQLSNKKLFCF